MNESNSSSYSKDYSYQNLPPEIVAAYKEAKARGLPDGWTCTIDKRNRRKWTAPNNGRSCDSIPKALAISVELGLLPSDFVIPKSSHHTGTKKQHARKNTTSQSRSNKRARLVIMDPPTSSETAAVARSLLSIASSSAAGPSSSTSNQGKTTTKTWTKEEESESEQDEEEEEEDLPPPPVPMNPETTFDLDHAKHHNGVTRAEACLPTTVHWDPNSPDGRKIGWRVKVERSSNLGWIEGRIVDYDPHTHKHKIRFDGDNDDDDDDNEKKEKQAHTAWIWLRNTQHNLQLATRLVWAHVKGYAWWPALVMETVSAAGDEPNTSTSVLLEFFGTGEISRLRDSPETIRPFDGTGGTVDDVVAKHRKKRNARAHALACEEYRAIVRTRNAAAVKFAKRAFRMTELYASTLSSPNTASTTTASAAQYSQKRGGPPLLGKRIQIFRNDVNYPYGDTVVAKVRQYSCGQKKYLLSFEISQNNNKYPPTWLSINSKDILQFMENDQPSPTNEDIVPYLFGFNLDSDVDQSEKYHDDHRELVELMKTRCRGCLEYLKKKNPPSSDPPTITCNTCQGTFHLSCVDPPLSFEAFQRQFQKANSASNFVCSRCTMCIGCYQHDICFGSHTLSSPIPPMLTVPEHNGVKVSLDLCSMCKNHYDAERFCPNCAHTWDDKKLDMIRRQIEHGSGGTFKNNRGANRRNKNVIIEDRGTQIQFGYFSGDEILPHGASVHPSWYYPETSEWGYSEDEMLVCDDCNVWVHAGCSGLTEDEYDVLANGGDEGKDENAIVYSKEFFCRQCCRRRCRELIESLRREDQTMIFATPVSEKIVPNYRDLIKEPMDLQTMMEKANSEEYLNYVWVREMFELMVLNALTFNRYYTSVWKEAQKFYHAGLSNVFEKIGKAAPPSKFASEIQKCFQVAEEARKNEEERVQVDESVEKKDLVAGSLASLSITLPKLRESPPDQPSCVPFQEVKLKPIDAFYCSWMDCCFTCGTSGASDTFLFCVDCGEAFHSFCANAPIHSMRACAVAGWRCPNCKICEVTGDVPYDENCMLFCDMCDRGFSLDSLDPPLRKPPSGLWVCGQCVDCKECGNNSEKDGISLRYWSLDPEKCFRCGGCEDPVNDIQTELKCKVCAGFLREDDLDIVECHTCHVHVHVSCDERAEEYVTREAFATRAQKVQGSLGSTYQCPSCRPAEPLGDINETIHKMRQYLRGQAKIMIQEKALPPHDNYPDDELLEKLIEKTDWATRNLWRDEYLSIIRDAVRIYSMAKNLGDPRFVIQQVVQRMHQLPGWLGQRALRFAVIVKQRKLDMKGFSSEDIVVVCTMAKLAAAFIDIVCRTLGIDKQKDISFHDRVSLLVKAPERAGLFSFPYDRLKKSNDTITIDDSGFILDLEQSVAHSQENFVSVVPEGKTAVEDESLYKVAIPLCGWAEQSSSRSGIAQWKDTRECCLCHICGDDDAGLPVHIPGSPNRALLGRLLPMADGFWVHTSCALWSSEVWETSDGIVHAVEKARSRGSQLKCFGCGLSGATVGCTKSNCMFNYHYPCAKECGAVFSSNQEVYCSAHASCAPVVMDKESVEVMKALFVAPEKKDSNESSEGELCTRVGSLLVHSLGTIESNVDGFHSENYITPPGFVSTRIFWSGKSPRSRTVYICKIESGTDDHAVFSIIPGDDPKAKIVGNSVSQVHSSLLERVKKVNNMYFSMGNLLSKLPVVRRTRRRAYGLNGPQFFGFGLNHVRKMLESSPGVEAVAAPLTPNSPRYRFCFTFGPDANDSSALVDLIKGLQRKRAAAKAEQASQNSSGCARTEGIKAVMTSGGSGRITRALVRSAEDDSADIGPGTKKETEVAKQERNLVQMKYRRMNAIPIEQRLVARRSHIHGWGLFTKIDIPKHDPVVEYMGEVIRRPVADQREKAYELSGEGSCYMFRLDLQRIVDATKIGCMARFMNHSCDPNAYAKIMSIDTDLGQEKKIVVFANRDILAGEEITYDYKFPVEDGSLRCTCGAPNCIGRLN